MKRQFEIAEDDLKTARETVTHWPELVVHVVDGYRSNGKGLTHGVQKDAIQNSWGARKKERGIGWSVRFELIESSGLTFLTIEDRGTCGLTGRVLKPEEYLEDLPEEERWGRFESLAFSRGQSEKVLGSRGRGKFIFVGASQDQTILYDTLRGDGVYRFGFRTVKKISSPVNSFDGKVGAKKITEYTKGLLKPLKTVGTRVMIVNPVTELVDAVKSGELKRNIEETWWEILHRYGADIRVSGEKVILPEGLILNAKESESRKVWKLKNQLLRIGGKRYKIKEFYAVCDKKNLIPEDIRGVSIQRSGMKICSISLDYLPKEIGEGLFGYVIIDRDFETELLKDEGVEHYSFDFVKQHPRALKNWIRTELNKFAREKLGLGVDPRRLEEERYTNAERKALNAFNLITSRLGFRTGPNPPPPPPQPPPPPPVVVKLIMPYFRFPHEDTTRANYGETIENIALKVLSRKPEFKARIQLNVLLGEDEVDELLDGDFSIKTGEQQVFGPSELNINPVIFPKQGEYKINARMISLEDEDKGEVLDELNRRFYVEQDPPPSGGIFERCESSDFPEEHAELMGYPEPGIRKGTYVLKYNKNHPAKQAVEDDEDKLADYLFLLMALALPQIDLQVYGENPKLMKDEKGKPLTTGETATVGVSQAVGKILSAYYSR